MTSLAAFSRTDNSVVGRWWWTVDRWMVAAVGLLVALGLVLTMAASPAIADRLHLSEFHFLQRQLLFLVPAAALLIGASLLDLVWVRRLGVLMFLGAVLLTLATLFVGKEFNGATRWLSLAGFSLQPSEFLKPSFAMVTAWMLAEYKRIEGFPGAGISLGLFVCVIGLLVLQPDIGMALVIGAVWLVQIFVAGLPLVLVALLSVVGSAMAIGAYLKFPHVSARIDRFLDPASGENYQVNTALEAFRAGGLFGRGPGEGSVKSVLPDAHTDFIFAVAGEEFGLLLCLLVVGLFAFIILRGFSRLLHENSFFVILAATGLLVQFGLQAVINIGVNLRLMPAKGMTLPFISYGGSSLLATALGVGMLLALTRRRADQEVGP